MPLHFTAFHPDCKMMDRPPTPPATLSRAREIARGNGVRYAYTGNVHDDAGGTTCCHGCGALVIGRDWYGLTELEPDRRRRLPRVRRAAAGRFEPGPATGAPRRLPVRLAATLRVRLPGAIAASPEWLARRLPAARRLPGYVVPSCNRAIDVGSSQDWRRRGYGKIPRSS